MIQLLAAFLMADSASIHQPDTRPLEDSARMVSEITQTSFSLQYGTSSPCETRVEIREGGRFAAIAHATPSYRATDRGAGLALWHTITVTGLKPGKRYYYRILNPTATPTGTDAEWGASAPWSREYAVSTEAPAGRKTIIHLPVKVLLMPNVVNAESAVQPDGSTAPDPPKITPDQLKLIEHEYEVASRFYWANSGMRLWVDFQFTVDDRWQRWGPPASGSSAFFQNLPPCRSYGGADFVAPGGGVVSFVDMKNPSRESTTPIDDGFVCQIEQAWPRRWDPALKAWKFYVSGGNTIEADNLTSGIPARSQFLAGSDTSWLAADEFHHQLESLGAIWLANSEDDRIVSDKPAPRHRNARGDGTFNEQAWTTTGPHGELWDDLRYWDKQVSDCQWLRFGFGSTEMVVDRDGDGFPDNDARLPMDAKRLKAYVGESSYRAGCNWDYVWVPVQPSWNKDFDQSRQMQPDGVSGTESRTVITKLGEKNGAIDMLVGHVFGNFYGIGPKLYPFHGSAEANLAMWESVPETATLYGNLTVKFKQAYDEAGYYGIIDANGPLDHVDIDLDGGELGLFTPPGGIGFTVTSLKPAAGQAGPTSLPVSVKPTLGGVRGQMPWLTWNSKRDSNGNLVFAFKIPNDGDGPWYWHGAGHRIGFAINAYDTNGRGYSLGEPYKLNYCRMAESIGNEPHRALPSALDAPEVTANLGVAKTFGQRVGFTLENDVFHSVVGTAGELIVNVPKANEFDETLTIEGNGDFAIGGSSDQNLKPGPDGSYSLVIHDGRASVYVYGVSTESEPLKLGPGPHKYRLVRQGGGVWGLIDGKLYGYARDPLPNVVVTKLGLGTTAHSDIAFRAMSYRVARNP